MDNQQETQDFFTKIQAETAGKAGIEIFKLLGNTENLFILDKSPESLQKNNEAYETVLAEILVILEKHKVGITNINFAFAGIKSIVDGIQQYINNHVGKLRLELASRTVGSKNPLDGKFDIEYATHAELGAAVLKIREEQGNNVEDFHTVVKNEPEALPEPSPYAEE